MINLFRITSINFDDFFQECNALTKDQKEDFLNILEDIIKYAPQKSQIISNFLILLIKDNPDLKIDIKNSISKILSTNNTEDIISTIIYCKILNYKISYFPNLKILENDYFKEEEIKLKNELEINEYLNNLEIFLEDKDFKDEILLFKIISIIKNYQFDTNDCLDELDILCNDNEELYGILYLQDKINNFYLINLILKILNDDKSVNNLFKIFDKFNKKFRDILISFIYESFINRRIYKNSQDIKFIFDSQEEIQFIKNFIDKETVKEMMKYLSIQSLESFVPEFKEVYEINKIDEIKKEEFDKLILKNNYTNKDNNSDKKDLFINFCRLGSPSISHFLSYLEIYKDILKMNDEDQKIFIEVFNELFINQETFKNVVIGKMIRFGFIKKEYVK